MIDDLAKAIQARLLADTVLFGATPATTTAPYPGLVRGGIYDRKVRREGFGATPRAYDDDSHVRPCIVIVDMEEVLSASFTRIRGEVVHPVRLLCMAPAHGAGKVVLTDISDRVSDLLLLNNPDDTVSTEPWIPIIGGKRLFPEFGGRLARKDSEEYPQVVEESVTINFRYIRRAAQL